MFLDVYLAENECRITDVWPNSHEMFWKVLDNIKTGKWEGGQFDWGGWRATITKPQALKFFRDQMSGHYCDIFEASYRRVLGQIEKLEDGRELQIIALET